METFQSLSFHRNQKWKQLNTPDIRRRDRAAKLQEYFATQLHKLLDVWSFFFFFSPQYLGRLPPQPQIPGLLSTSGETSQFNSFSESMPGLRAASHRWWAPSAFIFTSPLLNNNSKFVIIFEDSIGIKTNITQAGFHYYIFIIIVTQNLNILLDP